MKKTYKTLLICIMLGFFAVAFTAMAGNRDRSGQSGAQHLLVDPWAHTAGWGSCGVAETRGLESIFSNIAGVAFTKKTEIAYTRTQYFTGNDGGININAFGIAQGLTYKNKETGRKVDLGTIAISVFAMGFGDINATTVVQPDGDGGIFSPKLNYIGIHYAKSFNRFIHGGVSFKIVNESITDIRSNGIAIDVGVQYLSGPYENFKIGVALRNLGLPMRYKGDGIAQKVVVDGTSFTSISEARAAEFELPALLTIGVSYDFLIFSEEYQLMSKQDRKDEGLTRNDAIHRITLAGSFIANAYSRDNFAIGIEYGFMKYFQVRAGYLIESFSKKEIEGKNRIFVNHESIYLGPSAGVTVGIPLAKKGKGNQILQFDYAYRFTNLWQGNHYIGVKIAL
ncbi:MAG: PorV/PorQ family protein [Bacteroidetes bacterium]|nr:PorV/PorQ family protein [Bacteroidota bacterium]MCL1968265.1 PorV/PorQ family protein [Bacteroidota bacterium]